MLKKINKKYFFKFSFAPIFALALTLVLMLAAANTFCAQELKNKKTHVETIQQILPVKDVQQLVLHYLADDWVPAHTFATQTNASKIEFSPNSKIVGFTDSQTAQLWQLPEIKLVQQIPLLSSMKSFSGMFTWARSWLKDLGAMPIAFSPDGKFLATKQDYKTINIWQKKNNGYSLHQTLTAGLPIQTLTFSPSGEYLAAGQNAELIYIWRLKNNLFQPKQYLSRNAAAKLTPQTNLYEYTGEPAYPNAWKVYALAFSPNGTYLAANESRGLRLFKYTYPEQPTSTPAAATAADTATQEDTLEQTIAQLRHDMKVLDEQQERQNFQNEPWYRYSHDPQDELPIPPKPAISPDRYFIVSSPEDKTIKIWESLANANLPNANSNATALQNVAVRGQEKAINMLIQAAKDTQSVDPRDLAIADAQHAVDRFEYLNANPDAEFITRDKAGKQIGHTEPVLSIAFSPNGLLIATGSGDKTVKIWYLTGEKYRLIKTIDAHIAPVTAVTFSADGKTLATGSWDGTVKFWDVQNSFNFMHEFVLSDNVNAIAYAPNGVYFAAAYGKTVQLWKSKAKVLSDDLGLLGTQNK